MSARRPVSSAGLSLPELLTVLAIVAILAGIALPAYQGHLQRSRRSDALAALYPLQQAQLRYRGFHADYAPDLATLGLSADSPQGYYRLDTGRASDGHGFFVVARARDDGPQAADRDCREMTLTQRNQTTALAPAACWGR
nr:type IV pilin protein [Chromobacterium sp. ASV5]